MEEDIWIEVCKECNLIVDIITSKGVDGYLGNWDKGYTCPTCMESNE